MIGDKEPRCSEVPARVHKRDVRSVWVINVKMGSYLSGRRIDGDGVFERHVPFERRRESNDAM